MGKTALLEYLAGRAADAECRVLTVAAIESEMELAFAGLHQLCWPLMDHLGTIPTPQRDALSTVFGLTGGGEAPDRFLVGLAVLSLLAEAAADRPLVCIVDDEQWLDRASARVLAFVAHRLGAESVGLVFGGRGVSAELEALPEMVVGGLAPVDARALLATVLEVGLTEAVVDQIIAETAGNPLALLELPKGLTAGELATGFLVPGARRLSARVEESFRRRAEDLPPEARRLLLLAAAEPLGDPALLWEAAGRQGISTTAAPPLEDAGLIEFGGRVRFRHPLVRSAVYQSASSHERRHAHAALAEVIDPALDPDRQAWHRALATLGPDEDVAQDLERSAARAQARGGLAAAAALLDRSRGLTVDPARRARRTIAAARAHLEAGAPGSAEALLSAAEAGPLDEVGRASVELIRGQAAMGWGDSAEAVRPLVRAATRLESVDVRRARDTYAFALGAASHACCEAPGASLHEVARAARAAPTLPGPPRPHDLLLDGYALVTTEGWATAGPPLRQAVAAFAKTDLPPHRGIFWFIHACGATTLSWDIGSFTLFSTRSVEAARDLGALAMLPMALDVLAVANIFAGNLAAAGSLVGEAEALVDATGSSHTVYSAAQLAGWRGYQAADAVIGATMDHGHAHGQGVAVKIALAAGATLCNGLAQYDKALTFARRADDQPLDWSSHLRLHELVEAAARSGQAHLAGEALERLSESTQASGTDWALGIEARSRALVSDRNAAEALYLEAIERLDRSPIRPETARAHLLYGEWLRRDNRRVDARQHLRAAHGQLSAIGMEAFAERARHELAATGETVRKRTFETFDELTPQELQIARFAAEGLSNPQIGSHLFLSRYTVDYHLRKVFTKLGVTSRNQLRESLARSDSA